MGWFRFKGYVAFLGVLCAAFLALEAPISPAFAHGDSSGGGSGSTGGGGGSEGSSGDSSRPPSGFDSGPGMETIPLPPKFYENEQKRIDSDRRTCGGRGCGERTRDLTGKIEGIPGYDNNVPGLVIEYQGPPIIVTSPTSLTSRAPARAAAIPPSLEPLVGMSWDELANLPPDKLLTLLNLGVDPNAQINVIKNKLLEKVPSQFRTPAMMAGLDQGLASVKGLVSGLMTDYAKTFKQMYDAGKMKGYSSKTAFAEAVKAANTNMVATARQAMFNETQKAGVASPSITAAISAIQPDTKKTQQQIDMAAALVGTEVAATPPGPGPAPVPGPAPAAPAPAAPAPAAPAPGPAAPGPGPAPAALGPGPAAPGPGPGPAALGPGPGPAAPGPAPVPGAGPGPGPTPAAPVAQPAGKPKPISQEQFLANIEKQKKVHVVSLPPGAWIAEGLLTTMSDVVEVGLTLTTGPFGQVAWSGIRGFGEGVLGGGVDGKSFAESLVEGAKKGIEGASMQGVVGALFSKVDKVAKVAAGSASYARTVVGIVSTKANDIAKMVAKEMARLGAKSVALASTVATLSQEAQNFAKSAIAETLSSWGWL